MNNVAMSTYRIVSTITTFTLESFTQPMIVQFEIDYATYSEKVVDIIRNRTSSNKITQAFIMQCLKPELLRYLYIVGEIRGASSASEATDSSVETWFKRRLHEAPSEISERVKHAINSDKFTECPTDPVGAVTTLVLKLVSALDRSRVSEIVQNAEKCKSLVLNLAQKQEPAELNESTRRSRYGLRRTRAAYRSSRNALVSYLSEKINNGNIARSKLKRRADHNLDRGDPRKQQMVSKNVRNIQKRGFGLQEALYCNLFVLQCIAIRKTNTVLKVGGFKGY